MMLKTLGKTSWSKIKVGEIFAYDGCWCIVEKTGKDKSRLLAWDCLDRYTAFTDLTDHMSFYNSDIYKLPLSVQRLWNANL